MCEDVNYLQMIKQQQQYSYTSLEYGLDLYNQATPPPQKKKKKPKQTNKQTKNPTTTTTTTKQTTRTINKQEERAMDYSERNCPCFHSLIWQARLL